MPKQPKPSDLPQRDLSHSHASITNILGRITVAYANMPKGAKRIADFVREQPHRIISLSVTELSDAIGVSEGSIIKFCQNLGLSGFQQLKLSLAQESVQPVQFIHEDLNRDDDTDTVCRKIFHSGIQALSDTLSVLDADTLDQAVQIFRKAERIEIYGIGSAAPIAEDAHYRMLRIGLNAKVVIDSHVQAISASLTDSRVAILTVSHSGATHETVTSTRLAKAAGAKTVVITNFAKSPIQSYADVVLFTMARETLFRTEAMTSRIAQLCVVDALIAALALADYEQSTTTLKQTFETLSIKRF